MKTINIIEIDYNGEVTSHKEYQFEFLPRIAERIILPEVNSDSIVFKVMDIHHIPNKKTTLYVMSDYRSLKDVIQSITNSIV